MIGKSVLKRGTWRLKVSSFLSALSGGKKSIFVPILLEKCFYLVASSRKSADVCTDLLRNFERNEKNLILENAFRL